MATIMIVDDDAAIRDLVSEVLKVDGHQIIEERDGETALDKLGVTSESPPAVRPDLIILDVMMPGMDGFTAHNHLQKHERTRRIPLLILTSKAQMKDPFQGSSNVGAFMSKPFLAAELRSTVSALLKTRGKS